MKRPHDHQTSRHRTSRHRQFAVWLGLAVLMGLLLSIFSAGLFLYAALVVGGAFAVSLAFSTAAARRLGVRRELSQGAVGPGQGVDVTLTIENHKALPVPWLFCQEQLEPGLEVEGGTAALQPLGANDSLTLSYKVSSSRRGLYRLGPSVTEASDPLGFVRRFVTDEAPRFLTIFPRALPIGDTWPLGHNPIHRMPRRRSLFEDPSRFVGIRAYQPSDSIRRIHWRATARLRSLQVKTFEPAVLEGAMLVVDGAPIEDEELFELAVSAAASIAEYVLHEGQALGLLSNGGDAADRYPRDWTGETFRRIEDVLERTGARQAVSGFRPMAVEPNKGSWQRDRIRAALARLVPAAGVTLAELLELELPRMSRSLVLIVITSTLDKALALTLDGLQRSGFELAVVWIRPEDAAGIRLPPLPAGVPFHAISNEVELESLGAHAL